MIKNKCFVCGSSNFRADRALSGRLFCTSCGTPFGVRKVGKRKSIMNNSEFINNKNLILTFIFIIVFIIIII